MAVQNSSRREAWSPAVTISSTAYLIMRKISLCSSLRPSARVTRHKHTLMCRRVHCSFYCAVCNPEDLIVRLAAPSVRLEPDLD